MVIDVQVPWHVWQLFGTHQECFVRIGSRASSNRPSCDQARHDCDSKKDALQSEVRTLRGAICLRFPFAVVLFWQA